MDAIRVFIGTEPKTTIAEQVLRHSVRTRTAAPVTFTSMDGPDWQVPPGLHQGTGFSLRRWLIPSRCGFAGRAIYLDADQVVFADIAGLWAAPDGGTAPAGTSCWMTYQPDKFRKDPWPQSSVMVIDCAAAEAQWQPEALWAGLREGRVTYPDFMHGTWLAPQPARLADGWNHLNVFRPGETSLLHYTKEDTQPWYNPGHALADLWRRELAAAIKAGCVDRAAYEAALGKWGVKEDWRPTNGLHPIYRKYLTLFPK